MGIQVKAVERNISFEKGKEEFAYVMQTSNYNLLDADKVMQQAALMTGLPKPILQASWYGIGEVIKTWVTEGHCVSLPGLGNLRFGVRGLALKIRRKLMILSSPPAGSYLFRMLTSSVPWQTLL